MLKFKDLEVGKKYKGFNTEIGSLDCFFSLNKDGELLELSYWEDKGRVSFISFKELRYISFKELHEKPIDYITFEEAKEHMCYGGVCNFHGFKCSDSYTIRDNTLVIYDSVVSELIGAKCNFNMTFLEAKWVKK